MVFKRTKKPAKKRPLECPLPEIKDNKQIANIFPLKNYFAPVCFLFIGREFIDQFSYPIHAENFAFKHYGVDEARIYQSIEEINKTRKKKGLSVIKVRTK